MREKVVPETVLWNIKLDRHYIIHIKALICLSVHNAFFALWLTDKQPISVRGSIQTGGSALPWWQVHGGWSGGRGWSEPSTAGLAPLALLPRGSGNSVDGMGQGGRSFFLQASGMPMCLFVRIFRFLFFTSEFFSYYDNLYYYSFLYRLEKNQRNLHMHEKVSGITWISCGIILF